MRSSFTCKEICEKLNNTNKNFSHAVAIGKENLTSESPFKYECPGVLINNDWVISSSKCASDDLNDVVVKMDSLNENEATNAVDRIKRTPDPNYAIVALHLSKPITSTVENFLDINTYPFERVIKSEVYDAFIWRRNGNEEEMIKNTLKIQNTIDCYNISLNLPNGMYCAETSDKKCYEYVGAPILKNNILVGIIVDAVCGNIEQYFVVDISSIMVWLKTLINT